MSTHVRFLLARNLHSRSPWFPERLGTARFPGAQGRAVQNGVQEVRLIFCPVNIQKEVDNHTHTDTYIHIYIYIYIYINCPKGGFPSGFPPKKTLAYGIVEYFRIFFQGRFLEGHAHHLRAAVFLDRLASAHSSAWEVIENSGENQI